MCCDKNQSTEPSTRAGQVQDQVRGNLFSVSVPGVGRMNALARNASIRPLMNVTVVQVGGQWRIV